MSNEKHQAHHRPAPNAPLSEIKGIPVAIVQFNELLEIPGKLSSQGLKSELDNKARKRWRITYLPSLRAYELQLYAPSRETPDGTYYVHEHRVAWWMPA